MAVKILIVEDDPVTQLQYSEILKKQGTVYLASSGEEAIILAMVVKPDVIFLDIELPGCNGFDVVQKLKSKQIPASVIMITAHNTPQNFIESVNSGVSYFLTKPVHADVIEVVLSNTLQRRQQKANSLAVIKNAESKFSNIISMLSEAVVVSDEKGIIQFVNQYCLNLFGYEHEELIGKNVKILTPPSIAKQHDQYIEEYNKTRQAHLIGNPRELEAVTKSGKKLIIDLNLSEFKDSDSRYYLGVIRDVTEKREMEEKLHQAAMFDALTGLRTRLSLSLELDKVSHTELKNGFILTAMLDVDDFQTLNTVLGFKVCDELLKTIASKLRHIQNTYSHKAYRVSADRFVVLGFSTDKDEAFQNKEILLDELEQLTVDMYRAHAFTVSITCVGYVTTLSEQEDNTLTQQLELSLKSARSQGKKGQVARASQLDNNVGLQIASLKLDLASNVDENTLYIVLQPKVNKLNKISSFEALLRWQDTRYPKLNLGHYIAAAEETGAIIQVGYFVIEQTCAFLADLHPAYRKRIFINLSIRQLFDANFTSFLASICAKHNIDHQYLGFELTESMVADDIVLVSKQLQKICDLGFEIAIDDFGTGQSNLRYIHKLPISQLKIDKSFIDDITDTTVSAPLVDSVYQIAKAMNLTVVAEGVEKLEQVDYLRKLGVEEIQGFYFYKPMPVEQCKELILENSHYSRN